MCSVFVCVCVYVCFHHISLLFLRMRKVKNLHNFLCRYFCCPIAECVFRQLSLLALFGHEIHPTKGRGYSNILSISLLFCSIIYFIFFFFNNLWLSSTTEIQTIHSKDKLLEGLCSFHFILICKCCGIYKIDLLSIVNKKYIAMFDYLRMISLLSVIASQSIFSLTFGFLPICWVEVCSKCISSIN